MSDIPIRLEVVPDREAPWCYQVRGDDGELCRLSYCGLWLQCVPEVWLDLVPFMVARVLLAQGYDAERQLMVRLPGAGDELVCAPLGAAAATPLVNTKARCALRERRKGGAM